MSKIKFALLGNGKLNEVVAQAYTDGLLPEYELVGVMGRTPEKTEAFAQKFNIKACFNIEELLELKPQYVAEAASVQALVDYSEIILSSGVNLIALSIGAFVDTDFLNKLIEIAKANKTRIHVANGAVGGFDAIRTACLMGNTSVEMRAIKTPSVVARTGMNYDGLIDVKEKTRVFEGSTREAIKLMPTQVNVSIATSIAGVGVDETRFDVDVVPGYVGDEHQVSLKGDGVTLNMQFYSKENDIAGWSVVALMQNLVSPLVF